MIIIYLVCQKSQKLVESFILKNANQKHNQHAYKQVRATLTAQRGNIYSYFEKGCRKQMCTRQSRKVIWDMINTLFLTLQLSNLLLLLFFSTRKHTSMTSRTILSNFFEEQWTQNRPTVPFGIVACTFSDNLSRNSCMCNLYEPNCEFFRRRFVEQNVELSR